MSSKSIKELHSEAKAKVVEAKSIFDRGDEATIDDRQRALKLTEEAQAIGTELEKFGDSTKALGALNVLENSLSTLNAPARPPQPGGDGATLKGAGNVAPAYKSAGDFVLEDDAFADWLRRVAPNGRIPGRLQAPSPPVELKTLVTGAGSTSGGPLVWSDQRRDLIVPLPFRPLTIRSLLNTIQTNSDTVEYVRVTGYTNNAAPVAEATATSGSSGLKPESALALVSVSDTIKTIAHWIPATTRVLADAPQIRGLIDSFLRQGIDEELEDQIMNGAGTGENFRGFYDYVTDTDIATEAFATSALVTARKARTTLRVTGRATPTAFVMHPADWEDFDLLADETGAYYWGGPMNMGTPRLWGVPVVESEAADEGLPILGDFRQAVLFDRQQTSITIGTVDDDFIRNMVRILAEARYGFGVLRTGAFLAVDLTS
jgi:HK97 family phage major capsid protein